MTLHEFHIVTVYCRSSALALRLHGTPRYAHHQRRTDRLYFALPKRIRRFIARPV